MPHPHIALSGIEAHDKLANMAGERLEHDCSKADVTQIWGDNWLRGMNEGRRKYSTECTSHTGLGVWKIKPTDERRER